MSRRLDSFKKGEWIVTTDGKIAQILEEKNEYGSVKFSNGYVDCSYNGGTEAYPLTLHTKVIAEGIDDYFTKFVKKGLLFPKTGRKLEEFGYRLLELSETASHEKYREIYNEMDVYMQELEEHMKYFKD